MKFLQITALLLIVTFSFTACNIEVKKKPEAKELIRENSKKIAFDISGMTCEIGCAKIIQSKLSKKKGIMSAKVIFKDSTGLVEYNERMISKEEISALVNGIAGGNMYRVENLKNTIPFKDTTK